MKNCLILTVVLTLTGCASSPQDFYELPAGLSQITDASVLACQFDKQVTTAKDKQQSHWYLWRAPMRMETRDELTQQGELWERNNQAQMFYTKLFFNEKTIVEFVPGDLAALGKSPSWPQLHSLIDPAVLGKRLLLTQEQRIGDTQVQHYRGKLQQAEIELAWLPNMQLPLRLWKKMPEEELVLTLKTCAQTLPVQPISQTELSQFRHLDYTDFGDMEDDPLVKRLEMLIGEHQHSGH
ncbi:hypothetical protein [Methylocucumis oryzae]|uniref:Lipoprotein n=1 Tax=Methylocucumis oryzae TaxID=1632867 RepID=A0A0F3IP10_9GAMM|nr:hypothetical protein [Methylocucumis oryzae]KJV07319.1 hypothetical protein VZ94_05680 [Methylocucumis oryzae]